MRRWLLVLLAIAAAGCGDNDNFAAPATQTVAEQLAATGIGKFLGQNPTSMTRNGEWEEYSYDPSSEKAICLGGSTYQVSLRRGNTDQLLLYLEGGGACWNLATCWQVQTAKMTAGSASGAGILEKSNPANPFDGWNVVYAPYCDGCVFSGDNIVDYGSYHTYHHGVQNLSAAVSLMMREFPHPSVIVVSGSSAGGYGTFPGYAVTRIAYPNTPLLVLNDSGPGLQNAADVQGVADRIANWHFTQFIPPDCSACAQQPAYLLDWGLERDPTLRAALFSYLQDGVIRLFLGLAPQPYEALLRSVTDDLYARHPARFKRFLVQGHSHTVLELPDFYTLTVNGTTMRDWTADFLSNGARWQDLMDQ
jgi:hypothetical protein